MKQRLQPEEYYRSLARVPTSAGAIFRNAEGEILFVKPTYKDYWDIPGGMTELHETPSEAVIREVKEELSIDIQNPRAFCIDFATNKPYDRVLFLFDCGIMDEPTQKKIVLDLDEIAEYRFESYENAKSMMSAKLQNRLGKSLGALENGNSCAYIESEKSLDDPEDHPA